MNLNVQRLFQRVLCGLGLASAMMFASGCFGSKTPERSYFSIDYALNDQPHYAEPKYDKSVVIHNFTTTTAYDRQEIVYRSNPFEFQYYWYRLWASKPSKMLRELVSKHIRFMNIFSDVTLAIEDRVPDYELDVEIMSIEELDASDIEWYAHVSMRITLSSFEDNSVVWSRDIDVKNAVADNQPVYVVKALSELLDTELTKAFQDMDKTIAAREIANPRAQIKITEDVSPSDAPAPSQKAASEAEIVDAPRASLKNKR